MPQFLVPVISAIGAAAGGAFGATLVMYSTQIAIGAALLGTLALSSAQASKAKRKARNQFNASQVDRLTNVATTVGPRMLVLGRARVGGNVFFRGSVGANKEKFVMLIALAAHEIDAVEAIYLNDVQVALDGSGYVQTAPYLLSRRESGTVEGIVAPPEAIPGTIQVSNVNNDRSSRDPYVTYQYEVFTPKARIRAYLGSPGQAAAAQVMADFPALWTAAHTASGVAYLHCEFWYDETAFPSGLPNVTAVVRGAKCFDPRTSTTVWSENPAILARHVITHPQFGKRASLSAAEDARIAAAANACDTAHSYNGVATALYRASLVVPFGGAARDAIDDLVQAMAGQWAHAAGEFSMKAGVYTAPVLSLGEADLAVVRSSGGAPSQQPISISVHRARNDKFNVVAPKIWDAGQGYKQVSVTPLKAAALIARDGAELVQDVDMPGVFFAPQALHVAGVAMRDARDPLVVTAPFKLSAYRVELFDNIQLTLPRFGWSSKVFNVQGRKWSLDGSIELTLKETAVEIFQPDASFEVQGYAENTALPAPWDINPPAIIAVSSGTTELIVQEDGTLVPRVRVQWAPVTDASIVTVELQWQVVPDSDWRSVSVPASETQAFLVGVADDQSIIIRARSRNSLALSDWGLQQVHVVVGKTEPPPNVPAISVSGDTITWGTVEARDLAGYLLRFNYGVNAWWESATPLHEGVITETPYTAIRRPQGLVTILVKAIDTTGNESAEPVWVSYVFPEALVENVLLDYPQDPTFPGAITGGSVLSGDLVADSIDAFWEPLNEPMYGPAVDDFYIASQFGAMAYEFSVTPGVVGSLVLLYAIDSGGFLIEYQTGGGEDFYITPDTDPFWEPTDDLLYGSPSAWAVWPGFIDVDGSIEVRFRITTTGGLTQGVIGELSAVLDVPDVVESLEDVAISALGTRLPITQTYNAIRTVQLTVQAGGTGISALRVDKNPTLGPLVQILNASGTAVAGVLDATVQGY
ncbi:phage tail protein [Hydrogenophaga sp.]|uniref:phage tail protein n=1 Tax=Hydrogenophaga sp. TaxID=1904254 RepID=UPI0027312977|nr:phage tail protein [Hydrogenophaga sp.]MDP1686890.1 phage tail protein [Hydrogenophaga sp.]